MEENVIQIKSRITINVNESVKTSYMGKSAYLETCYVQFQKW